MSRTIISKSPEDTRAAAAKLARRARPGCILTLSGPLGSGKTTFVQGFVHALGFRGNVASPSFAVAREYRLAKGGRVYHLDLYRVELRELGNLGLEEYLSDSSAICLIEWPEIVEGLLPPNRVDVRLSYRGAGGRVIRVISGMGDALRRDLSPRGHPHVRSFRFRSVAIL